MNRFESSAKPSSEREGDLRRLSEFHTVLLGVAGHDLHQPVQVIQSTDEWLSSMLDADADKVRQQLGEPAVARLSDQLDRLAGALRLYEHTTTMELSPVPLAPLFDRARTDGIDPVRQKGLDLCIRPTRAVVMSNTVLLDGIVGNLVRNAIKYAGGCVRKLWRRPRRASRAGTRLVMRLYPQEIREWIGRHGGLKPHIIALRGNELHAMYDSCR